MPTARTGGLFGSTTTTTQPSGGGLFENTQSTTANIGGGLFGSGTMTTGQSTSGGGLFGGSKAKPAGGACLGVRRPPRRILTNLFRGGQQQQFNLFGSTTNANPLLGGLFGNSALGTSTVGNGQQPQQQQLSTGCLLSSRSAGGLGQQQNDPASQHANLTARFEGIYMRGTLLLFSVGFRYSFFVGCFFFQY